MPLKASDGDDPSQRGWTEQSQERRCGRLVCGAQSGDSIQTPANGEAMTRASPKFFKNLLTDCPGYAIIRP